MNIIEKYWPTPFKIKKGELTSFITYLVIFILIFTLASILMGLVSSIPVLNVFGWLLGILTDLYGAIGIILCVLRFIGKI